MILPFLFYEEVFAILINLRNLDDVAINEILILLSEQIIIINFF